MEELLSSGRLLSSAQDLHAQKGGMNTPPANKKIAGNGNRNHQGQLKLEGDLTQINEQVANERQEESSLRGRFKMNTASDENLDSQKRQQLSYPVSGEERQRLLASSPDLPNEPGSDDNNQMANLNDQIGDNDKQQLLR